MDLITRQKLILSINRKKQQVFVKFSVFWAQSAGLIFMNLKICLGKHWDLKTTVEKCVKEIKDGEVDEESA